MFVQEQVGGSAVVVIIDFVGRLALSRIRRPGDVAMAAFQAVLELDDAFLLLGARIVVSTLGLESQFPTLPSPELLLCSATGFVSCACEVSCFAVYSSPRHKDMLGGEAVGLPAIARRILRQVFASLKRNGGDWGRGGGTGSGSNWTVSLVLVVFSRHCPNFSAKQCHLPNPSSATSQPHDKPADQRPLESAL